MTAARELAAPIIAMTITLAAVYAPVASRRADRRAVPEFAFTLAGAVVVSGVVALTLSADDGRLLPAPGDSERGFAAGSTAGSTSAAVYTARR